MIRWRLLHQAQDLDGGQGGQREHDMAGDLVGPAQADHAAGEVVLEVGVDALGGAALLVAKLLGGAQADAFLALGLGLERRLALGVARMRLDQGDMAQGAAVGLDLRALICGAS